MPERASVPFRSRLVGRGAILRALRGLLIRAQRYGVYRATTPDDQMWAARLADHLEAALRETLDAPGARASLNAAEARAQRSSKNVHRPDNASRFSCGSSGKVA